MSTSIRASAPTNFPSSFCGSAMNFTPRLIDTGILRYRHENPGSIASHYRQRRRKTSPYRGCPMDDQDRPFRRTGVMQDPRQSSSARRRRCLTTTISTEATPTARLVPRTGVGAARRRSRRTPDAYRDNREDPATRRAVCFLRALQKAASEKAHRKIAIAYPRAVHGVPTRAGRWSPPARA